MPHVYDRDICQGEERESIPKETQEEIFNLKSQVEMMKIQQSMQQQNSILINSLGYSLVSDFNSMHASLVNASKIDPIEYYYSPSFSSYDSNTYCAPTLPITQKPEKKTNKHRKLKKLNGNIRELIHLIFALFLYGFLRFFFKI